LAQRIQWHSPSETNITHVEVNRANTIYGSYSVLATQNATSDGNAKTSANTWVVTYTDATGNRNHWYKIRFKDNATGYFTDYSEPITAQELLRLCTIDDVKNVINTVGRWSDDEIFDAISEVDELIYIECGTPLQSVITKVTEDALDVVQSRYYVGEENIYRVDRLFYGTTTKQELFLDDGYKANNRWGMIEILPYASSGVTIDDEDGQELEIQFVPSIFHKLSLYRTCKYLLEQLDTTSGGTTSKELAVITAKLNNVETLLNHRIGLQLSSMVQTYDSIYGCNRRRLTQDVDRNKYLGSTGW
jgi:hypothetical protein